MARLHGVPPRQSAVTFPPESRVRLPEPGLCALSSHCHARVVMSATICRDFSTYRIVSGTCPRRQLEIAANREGRRGNPMAKNSLAVAATWGRPPTGKKCRPRMRCRPSRRWPADAARIFRLLVDRSPRASPPAPSRTSLAAAQHALDASGHPGARRPPARRREGRTIIYRSDVEGMRDLSLSLSTIAATAIPNSAISSDPQARRRATASRSATAAIAGSSPPKEAAHG